MTYIEQYYKWLLKNPEKANHKVLVTYKKLVEDLKKPKTVSFFNAITEEQETHTYIFDEHRGNLPIEFIERFCKHSKGKWAGQPVQLELFQKAFIQALFGFVDKDTGIRKYKKGALFIGRKNGKSTMASPTADALPHPAAAAHAFLAADNGTWPRCSGLPVRARRRGAIGPVTRVRRVAAHVDARAPDVGGGRARSQGRSEAAAYRNGAGVRRAGITQPTTGAILRYTLQQP